MISRITLSELFHEDLGVFADSGVEGLNSKLHRERDYEYVHGDGPSPGTDSRVGEVTEKRDFRDPVSEGTKNPVADREWADLRDAEASTCGMRTTTSMRGPDFSEPRKEHHAR